MSRLNLILVYGLLFAALAVMGLGLGMPPRRAPGVMFVAVVMLVVAVVIEGAFRRAAYRRRGGL